MHSKIHMESPGTQDNHNNIEKKEQNWKSYISWYQSLLQSYSSQISVVLTSLVVQWLALCVPNAGGPGSIPGQEARSHMPQLRGHMLQLTPSTTK